MANTCIYIVQMYTTHQNIHAAATCCIPLHLYFYCNHQLWSPTSNHDPWSKTKQVSRCHFIWQQSSYMGCLQHGDFVGCDFRISILLHVPFSSFSIILNHSWNGSLLPCIFMCGLGRGVQGASPRSASKGDLIEICIPNVDFNASISWGQFKWFCFVGEVQSRAINRWLSSQESIQNWILRNIGLSRTIYCTQREQIVEFYRHCITWYCRKMKSSL